MEGVEDASELQTSAALKETSTLQVGSLELQSNAHLDPDATIVQVPTLSSPDQGGQGARPTSR